MVFSVFSVFFVFFLGFFDFFDFFGFFLGFFGLFRNSLFRCFGCFASITKQRVSIDLKQSEDPPKQFKREYIWVFFGKFRVVSVCFGLLRNSSVCFGCFDIGSKHRNKPKLFVIGFTKQTETNAKQILFRFVSVRTENYFCLFRGHPRLYIFYWTVQLSVTRKSYTSIFGNLLCQGHIMMIDRQNFVADLQGSKQ